MLNNRAHQKFLTSNPPTKSSASIIIIAFITNKNNPKDSIVAGIVKITRIGFTKVFNKDRTTATIRAEIYQSIETPGNRYAVIKTAKPLINVFTKKFMFLVFNVIFQLLRNYFH